MKAEFKNVKTMDGMEGVAFSASLYFDGKKVGSVVDDGNGGMPFVHFDYRVTSEQRAEWEAYCAACAAKHDSNGLNAEEYGVDALFDIWEERKQIRSWMRTKVAMRISGRTYDEGAWDCIVGHRDTPERREEIAKHYADKGTPIVEFAADRI